MGNNASKSTGEASASPGGNQLPSRSSSTTTPHSKSSSSRHPKSPHSAQASDPQRKHATSNPPAPPSHHPLNDAGTGNQYSKPVASSHESKSESKHRAAPVKVPHRGSDANRQRGPDTQFQPSGPPRDPEFVPLSNFGLPPRLPLPIGEELHTPGSPILDAQGSSALHEDEVNGLLPRRTSNESNNTLEDDELGNELRQYPPPYDGAPGTVSTPVYWKHGGEKVYVTGTFTGWSRKYRLNKDPATGYLSAHLHLPPGTHHVKFIIDGEMQLSDELPTAVDYTNILVNYIEVSADDVSKKPAPQKLDGIYPPQLVPEGTEVHDHEPTAVTAHLMEGEIRTPSVYWGRELPLYLKDYDKAESSNRWTRATNAINDFSPPPGLPSFLHKSILNGTLPMKDDSSVLTMPNHTVLNHLATSSIKNEVLATSITTRYIRKYVTTIVYKPTEIAPETETPISSHS